MSTTDLHGLWARIAAAEENAKALAVEFDALTFTEKLTMALHAAVAGNNESAVVFARSAATALEEKTKKIQRFMP